MRWVIFVAAPLLTASLSACATSQPSPQQTTQERWNAFNTASAQCDLRYKQGEFKTYHDRAICKNNSMSAIFDGHGDEDLLAQEEAYRLVVAEKLDSKQITEAEANLMVTQFRSGLNSEATQRNAQRGAASAAYLAGAASILHTLPMNQPQQVYQPPVMQPFRSPVTTNCNASGNSINCQSY
jgi:hypothetical protein